MRLGIIGGTGWLGSALGRALLDKHIVAPCDLSILNSSGPREAYFGHQVRWSRDATELCEFSDVIVVSVRPAQWHEISLLAPDRLVISFMAGITMRQLAGCGGRIVRAMPNAAAELGRSYTPWTAARPLTEPDRSAVGRVLGSIGTTEELPDEHQLEMMTAVSGAGPAFPALLATVLADFLIGRGIDSNAAERAALNVIRDCPALLPDEPGAASAMVRTFVDYAGTTAAGLLAAQEAGLADCISAGLEAAIARSAMLG